MEPLIISNAKGLFDVALGEWILISNATLDQARKIVRDIRIVDYSGKEVNHAQAQ